MLINEKKNTKFAKEYVSLNIHKTVFININKILIIF